MRRWLTLLISLSLSYGAASIGASFTAVGAWYAMLAKPVLNPPSWIFAPVWTLLYTLMAIAAWRVYEKMRTLAAPAKAHARLTLVAYVVHLGVNAFWSFAFFGLHDIALAFGTIIVLWLMIAALTVLFFRFSRIAGWLFLPYLAWVSFATYLNLSILLLN